MKRIFLALLFAASLSAQTIVGGGTAAASAATTATITDDTTTNATVYPVWVSANSGSLPLKVSSTKFSLNPSSGTLTISGGSSLGSVSANGAVTLATTLNFQTSATNRAVFQASGNDMFFDMPSGSAFFMRTLGVQSITLKTANTVALTIDGTSQAVSVAKAFVTTPATLTYASPTSVDPSAASFFTVTTVNATGSVTFNAASAGTTGQHLSIIITNDATSAKTITFGTNFSTTGTLTASAAGKVTTISFLSDGAKLYECGRAVLP